MGAAGMFIGYSYRYVRCDTDTGDGEMIKTTSYLTTKNVDKGQSHMVRISEQICLIFPRRRLLAAQRPAQEGRGKCGVNSTLEGAGSSKNYYIHPAPHHLSFQTDRRPRGNHLAWFFRPYRDNLFDISTLFFPAYPAPLLWQKEKEVNNTLTPTYWVNRRPMASSSPGRWVHSFIRNADLATCFLFKPPHHTAQIRGRRVFYSRICPEHLNKSSTPENWHFIEASHLMLAKRASLIVIFLHRG